MLKGTKYQRFQSFARFGRTFEMLGTDGRNDVNVTS